MHATLSLERVSSVDRLADVRRRLRNWLAHTFDREFVALVELSVTELVTNALLYGGGSAIPSAELRGSVLRVEVRDRSTTLPRLRDPGPTATNGRGLRIVASVSERWGVDLRDDEKIVWCEIPVKPRTSEGVTGAD